MARLSILEWDALGQAIGVKGPPAAIGSQLFSILKRAGYAAEGITTVARTLNSYVD